MLSRKSPIHAEGEGGHGEEQQQTDQAQTVPWQPIAI